MRTCRSADHDQIIVSLHSPSFCEIREQQDAMICTWLEDGVAVQIASRSHLRLRRPAGLFYAIPLQIPVYQAHPLILRWLGAVGLPETPQMIFAISVSIHPLLLEADVSCERGGHAPPHLYIPK